MDVSNGADDEDFKGYVYSMAQLEGLMAEGYILEETLEFVT